MKTPLPLIGIGSGLLLDNELHGFHSTRVVVVRILGGKSPHVILDVRNAQLSGDSPLRIYLSLEEAENLPLDPRGAFAPLRKLTCTNQHCHYYRPPSILRCREERTALRVCPNCRTVLPDANRK